MRELWIGRGPGPDEGEGEEEKGRDDREREEEEFLTDHMEEEPEHHRSEPAEAGTEPD
jgi:hypothetical protein